MDLNGEWARLYPILFRSLEGNSKFRRWQWIDYEWTVPKSDNRRESRVVQEGSITVSDEMPRKDRLDFLNKLVLPSTEAAYAKGMTLTLIRPEGAEFSWKERTDAEIAHERRKYELAASQGNFFDPELKAFEPCPYSFFYEYASQDGKSHRHECGDWEITATYFKWSKSYGERRALEEIAKVFGQDYPRKGMVFAMGTHSRRPQQWLLVGVIRLDEPNQHSLDI
ncbi:MAG: hypothetical protein MI755_02880 [Sphingomonadales bacterium]|nr:hypothetical protein [Sphingomonadales bacterium]